METIIVGFGILILITWFVRRKFRKLKGELKKTQYELKSVQIKFGQKL